MNLESVRSDVAAACRELAGAGLVTGSAGNVSVRVGELAAVTATGARFAAMTADDVTVVDLAGTSVSGGASVSGGTGTSGGADSGRRPTSEIRLHLGIYERYGTAAVVHTHPPVGTALSCVVDELPVVHYQLLPLGGAIRVAPYATFGTAELAAAVVEALEGRLGALMANHGAVTHGPSLADAVELSMALEWVCEVYWRACAIGTPRILDEEQQSAAAAAWTGYGR